MKISGFGAFFTHLIHFHIKILTVSHLCNLLPTYNDEIMLSVHNDSSPRSFPPWIRGTDKQLNINLRKHGGNVTFPLGCHYLPHVHFTHCNAAYGLCVTYILISMGLMEHVTETDLI
jgi:hypothetical protein